MKTLALLLASALSLTTACATDDASDARGAGLRPGYKPELEKPQDKTSDTVDIGESLDEPAPESDRTSVLDGSPLDGAAEEWAEERLDGITVIHGANGRTTLLDANGEVVVDGRVLRK